jgi:hypothetical protein
LSWQSTFRPLRETNDVALDVCRNLEDVGVLGLLAVVVRASNPGSRRGHRKEGTNGESLHGQAPFSRALMVPLPARSLQWPG